VSARAWTAFAAVSTLWGIPYLFIKIAVDDGMPPIFLAWARVTGDPARGLTAIHGAVALEAAVLVAFVQVFGTYYFPDFALAAMYLLMLLVLVIRPGGLLGKEA